MAKGALFTIKLETELRDDFLKEAEKTHRPGSQLVREFMREFVERQRETRAHDAWFRRSVREALGEAASGIPHDDVMAETRAIIDSIAAAKVRA